MASIYNTLKDGIKRFFTRGFEVLIEAQEGLSDRGLGMFPSEGFVCFLKDGLKFFLWQALMVIFNVFYIIKNTHNLCNHYSCV